MGKGGGQTVVDDGFHGEAVVDGGVHEGFVEVDGWVGIGGGQTVVVDGFHCELSGVQGDFVVLCGFQEG